MIDPDKYLDLAIDYKLLEKEYTKLATLTASLMEGGNGLNPEGIYIEIEELPLVREWSNTNGTSGYATEDFHLAHAEGFEEFLEGEIQSAINDVAQLLAIKKQAGFLDNN